jgi:hypothetical protein
MDWDWPMYHRVERQAKRLSDMIHKLDVDTGKLVKMGSGAAYAEAREKCQNCRSTHECLLWLDADPPHSDRPFFCPNLPLFEACKRRPG